MRSFTLVKKNLSVLIATRGFLINGQWYSMKEDIMKEDHFLQGGSHAVETALAVKGRMIAKSVQLVLISGSMADQELCGEFAGEKIYID